MQKKINKLFLIVLLIIGLNTCNLVGSEKKINCSEWYESITPSYDSIQNELSFSLLLNMKLIPFGEYKNDTLFTKENELPVNHDCYSFKIYSWAHMTLDSSELIKFNEQFKVLKGQLIGHHLEINSSSKAELNKVPCVNLKEKLKFTLDSSLILSTSSKYIYSYSIRF